jgi:hypothetical protein
MNIAIRLHFAHRGLIFIMTYIFPSGFRLGFTPIQRAGPSLLAWARPYR